MTCSVPPEPAAEACPQHVECHIDKENQLGTLVPQSILTIELITTPQVTRMAMTKGCSSLHAGEEG